MCGRAFLTCHKERQITRGADALRNGTSVIRRRENNIFLRKSYFPKIGLGIPGLIDELGIPNVKQS